MRLLLIGSIPLPALLAFKVDPQLSNLIVSVALALIAYFTGGRSPRTKKHRDDYDSN